MIKITKHAQIDSIRILCVLVVATAMGCSNNNKTNSTPQQNTLENKLLSLKQDSIIHDVDRAFGMPGMHQFTIERGNHEYLCVSYYVSKPYARYYALFKDRQLQGFIVPPPFDVEIVQVDGANVEIRKPVDPTTRIPDVIHSKALLGQDLVSSVQNRRPEKRSACDSNIGPALPILIPLAAAQRLSPAQLAKAQQRFEMVERYKVSKIQIGISLNKVNSMFGESGRLAENAGNNIIRLYGCDASKTLHQILSPPTSP